MLSSHLFHTPVGHFHGGCLTFIHISCFSLQLLQSFKMLVQFHTSCNVDCVNVKDTLQKNVNVTVVARL